MASSCRDTVRPWCARSSPTLPLSHPFYSSLTSLISNMAMLLMFIIVPKTLAFAFGFAVSLRGVHSTQRSCCLIMYCICHGLHTQKQGGERRQVDDTVSRLDYFNTRARCSPCMQGTYKWRGPIGEGNFCTVTRRKYKWHLRALSLLTSMDEGREG
jgi:hypothetical protein